MKKFLSILLVLTVVLSLTACGSKNKSEIAPLPELNLVDVNDIDKDTTPVEPVIEGQEEQEEIQSLSDIDEMFGEKEHNLVKNPQYGDYEGKIFYDENGIKLSALGFSEKNVDTLQIDLRIENNTETEIEVLEKDCKINDIEIMTVGVPGADPGTVSYEGLSIYYRNLEKAGIDANNIQKIELDLAIIDANTEKTIVDVNDIVLNTK